MIENENEQVTITFGGYDDTPDNTIMFEGPLKIWKNVDNIENLYLLDVAAEFTQGESVIVFVRNVNKTDPTKPLSGEIPYRGSFYQYDWERNGWQQIVLGNHSHANIEILDQLGNINTDDLPIGTKKVITLEKIDPDNDGNIRTTDYKVAFEDQKALPDIPVDAYGKNLYLTADKEGKYQWGNNFAPAQTFKIAKFVVSAEFALPEDAKNEHFKKLLLSKDYLNKNDILFDTELNDDILVFDNGELITDIRTEYNEDIGLTLIIDNDTLTEDQLFDIGEKITVLIIRNGIAGILDTIENQYMTKKDAIKLLSDGTIQLDQYTTKKDLRDYAAKINHTHSQYIRKDQYDVFDFRYADYQHTHSQYVTAEQVLGIIYDISGETGEINPDSLLTQIKEKIDKQLEEFDNKFYSKAQIIDLINATKEEVTNSDAITVTIDGRTLTDYLRYLDDKQSEFANVTDSKVLLSSVKVNLGENESVGGFKTGDIIPKGTTLNKFIKDLVQKEVAPKLLEPEFTCDYLLSGTDSGETIDFILTPHFIQNNAGRLIQIKLVINTTPNNINNKYEYILNNNEKFKTKVALIPYLPDGTSFTFSVVAEYAEGEKHINNLNNGKTYNIPAGQKTFEKSVYSRRKCYFGYLPFFADDASLTGDTMHQHIYSARINTLSIIDLNQNDYTNGKEIRLEGQSGVKTILFAMPHSISTTLKRIFFINQCYDMLEDFNVKTIDIPDASGSLNPSIDNSYDIYYYTLMQEAQSDLVFKLDFTNNRKDDE